MDCLINRLRAGGYRRFYRAIILRIIDRMSTESIVELLSDIAESDRAEFLDRLSDARRHDVKRRLLG